MKHLRARYGIPAVLICLVVGIGVASNRGFLRTYSLLGPADSASGTNWLSLPYRTRTSLETASGLYADLGGGANVTSISRYDAATDSYEVYTGNAQDDFNLVPGEGVRVVMTTTMDYKIFGSHDPTKAITLLGPGDSPSASNWFAPPYHSKALTAGELQNEIGKQDVSAIIRHLPESDAVLAYTGSLTDVDYTLVAGEAYQIVVNRTLQFVPKTSN